MKLHELIVRKVVRGIAVGLLAIASCRQVDPSNGAIDRAFGDKPREAVPAGVDAAYEAFVRACAGADAPAAWATMSRDLQGRIDEEARARAVVLPAQKLRADFGYRGHAAGFDGTAYLRGLLRGRSDGNPCLDADLWRRVDAGPDEATFIVVAERPDGLRQGLRFAELDEQWKLDAISAPVDPRPSPR